MIPLKPSVSLTLFRSGIDTQQEPVIYLRSDSPVCRAEGFRSQSRVRVSTNEQSVIATLCVVNPVSLKENGEWIEHGHAAVSEAAWRMLKLSGGEQAFITHTKAVDSVSYVRGKLYGKPFTKAGLKAIVDDVVAGRYTDIQIAAFVAACTSSNLSVDETVFMTEAMVDVGQRLSWSKQTVLDKHCIGGLPGNRTTPIVVAIVAACGLTIPKTSSRAITSPAGTADTMNALTPVELSLDEIKQVVDKEGGCMVWGGAVNLSPADDLFIRVERALNLDSEGQLVASVISKKLAAGSTHVVVDIPFGATAKMREYSAAQDLKARLEEVGYRLGLTVKCLLTNGDQPVGWGIGPSLEALDILAVLKNEHHAPADLRERALTIAGELLEMGGASAAGQGHTLAEQTLQSGRAWQKFEAICLAQGGLFEPRVGQHCHNILAQRPGVLTYINNRFISKLAKLLGAPNAMGAGIRFNVKLGERVEKAELLLSLYAETKGELAYALEFLDSHPNEVLIEDELV